MQQLSAAADDAESVSYCCKALHNRKSQRVCFCALMRTGNISAGRGMHDGHLDRRPRAHHKHARHGFSHDRMRGMDDEESHHYRFQHLEEVVGQLMSVAKDQNGCRCV